MGRHAELVPLQLSPKQALGEPEQHPMATGSRRKQSQMLVWPPATLEGRSRNFQKLRFRVTLEATNSLVPARLWVS